MRKLLWLFIFLILPACYVLILSQAHTDLAKLPPLQSGDLVFETTMANQSLAIVLATGSFYTHVGVVHHHADGSDTIIHASRTVIEAPLADFVHYGWGERITIKRYPGLTDAERSAIVARAESLIGRPYNYVFYMKSPDIYCSEVPYFAFNGNHIPLGHLQNIGDLHVNNSPVHNLFERRWRNHPACQAAGMTFDSCWNEVMKEPVITPASVEEDPHLHTIYSNYLF